MKDRLIIIGASGHGKSTADIAKNMNKWDKISFLDDDKDKKECLGYPVVGTCSDAGGCIDNADFFVAIGNNRIRKKVQGRLTAIGATFATLIHPDAVIGTNVSIGDGSVVMAGVVINCETAIGTGCIINTSSSVDHDNKIMDYVHVSPGANLAGTVVVGEKSWIGAGSTISNNINICSDCIIGAGSVVIDSIEKSGTYVGVPARRK